MSVTGPPGTGQVPQVESPSLVGQILDGRYRIVRKLGEGGMGEVYAAEHVHIEKRFAIKLLRPEIVSNPEAVTRFRQEARSSSSIGHRNIIAIEDFGQLADGRIYMCMELLNGAALNDMITQPMGVDRLLNILIQTGHGLAAAHAKGIVHRDMKPENIFVTIGPNGEDVPKLLDFGIAKVSGNDGQNHLTRTGTIFGTPFYMAPEQALGNPVDARTDIYAVGVIMYECFSGTLPFQGDSFMGILTQHITMEPEPVVQRAAKAGRQLPPGLAETITRCMQKNPAQRFQTMDELVNALIQIYRGIVGPGMSTYMEAFPVMPSAAHQIQPTPTPGMPMTGPVRAGHAAAPTVAAGRSASGPVVVTPSSGVYPAAYPAPNSRLGLIIALLVVLAVGGGVAAFLVVSGNHKPGPGPGSGSGSQLAIQGSGQEPAGLGAKDAGVALAPDAVDIAAALPDAAVEHTLPTEVPDGGTAGNTLPGTEVQPVQVLLSARNVTRFEVYENGAKLFDGPDVLPVHKGETRTVLLRAPGFKDKTLVVDATKHKVQFVLARLPGAVPGPGAGHGSNAAAPGPGSGSAAVPGNPPPNGTSTPPGPGSGAKVYTPNLPPDCSNKILDPRSKPCVDQYCAKHPDEDKCHML
jgi:tRNA A-37 threonylcarbamoyl transferase component Bud32